MVVQERNAEPEAGKEWREVTIGKIAEIFDGPHATPKKTDSGPVFLGISNLVNGRIDLSSTQHLSDDDYLSWTRRVTPDPGDIVFSYETRLGEAAAIPQGLRCCLGRRMGLLRARTESIDSRFLLYAYLGPEFQKTLQSRSVQGSTVDRILLSELGNFPIMIPGDVVEQRVIAHVLGTLDDKIELNRRMNETLEEMARALFKSWFVDFDPVRAKAALKQHALRGDEAEAVAAPASQESEWTVERARAYLAGIDPQIADLFLDRLVDSELGAIPEGWEVKGLDDIAEFTNGLALQRYPPEGDDWLPVIKIAEMRRGYSDKTGKASAKLDPRYIVEDGDLLFSWSASIELVFWAHGRGALNQHLFKVTSNEFPQWFCWGWNREHLNDFRAIAAGKATTMGHIQRHHLTDARVAVPPPNLLVVGDTFIGAVLDQGVSHAIQSRILAAQRDALLPKLTAGSVGA